MPALPHKFSMNASEARPGEYVLAVVHFDRVVALIASRGANDPEGQAEALIKARSPQYPDSYEIEHVKISNIEIQRDEPRRFVAEVTARNETEARVKLGRDDVQIKERG